MPFIEPVVMALAGFLGTGGFITMETAFTIADILVTAGAALGMRAVNSLLTPKPKTPGIGANSLSTRNTQVTGTNATKARDLIYGNLGRCTGTIVFRDFTPLNTTVGGVNQTFNRGSVHLVIALAGHQVESIGDPYLQNYNETAPLDPATGDCNSGRFVGKLHCEKFLGAPGQAACATLIAAAPQFQVFPNGWTSAHQLKGVAYVYVRMDWDENVFNQGFPDLRFDVVGKNDIYDPRTGTTGWSNNPIICLRDYFTWPMGIGCYSSEVNDTIISAEANVCDEDVPLAAGGTEKRFTANGTVDLSSTPADIVNALLSSCAGTPAYLSGQWAFYAAHWRGAVGSIGDDDLASSITINARQASSDRYNGVKGVFISADNNWQTSDFPPFYHGTDRGYASDDYLADDGGQPTDRRWKDIQLPFTTSAATAQRLAKLDLESFRREKTITVQTKISKFAHQPPDVVNFTHARWGAEFTNKTFAVNAAQLTMEAPPDPNNLNGSNGQGQSAAPALLMNFTLRETDANVYAWSIAEELAYTAPSGSTGGAPPPAPLIAEQLTAITTGLEFAFNYITYAPVQGYWVYRSSSTDVTTAARYRFIPQSNTDGKYTFQDLVGSGVTFYYWITAINFYGESAKEATFSGATSGLGAGDVMTVYRPTTGSGTYGSPSAAYDNNLSAAASVNPLKFPGVRSDSSTWSGFSAITGTVVSVTLRVVSDFAKSETIGEVVTPNAGSGQTLVEYSTDGGTTWTTLYAESAAGFSERTDSAALSTSVNLANLQVRATTSTTASTDSATHKIYEIWAEVVTSS
jgi:hypothetical protein